MVDSSLRTIIVRLILVAAWSGLGLEDVAHHLEMCVEAEDLINRMFVNQGERGAIGEGETGIRILQKDLLGLAPERFRNPMNRQCPRIHGLAHAPEELDRCAVPDVVT